ncbi:MAG: hypothetical protein A4E66_01532 [Syntrophus sp. PtaB.Bin001]|nr:MAG: hypothetical protein A4E66_01532 [Syntrophus sp. PtaB.Bin001]
MGRETGAADSDDSGIFDFLKQLLRGQAFPVRRRVGFVRGFEIPGNCDRRDTQGDRTFGNTDIRYSSGDT